MHRSLSCALRRWLGAALVAASVGPGLSHAGAASSPAERQGAAPSAVEFAGLRFSAGQTVRYRCDGGRTLQVRYFNGEDNQLALLTLDGKRLLFVNVLAASGARYANGRHIWWTRGPVAMLFDLTRGDQAPPVYDNCREQ